eukprot:Opistho-1_new@453
MFPMDFSVPAVAVRVDVLCFLSRNCVVFVPMFLIYLILPAIAVRVLICSVFFVRYSPSGVPSHTSRARLPFVCRRALAALSPRPPSQMPGQPPAHRTRPSACSPTTNRPCVMQVSGVA